MLLDCCLSCLSVCNVGALWPNAWMDQDETWRGGMPRPRPHCLAWAPTSPQKGHSPPIFCTCLLWPNGWMDQDATWYRGRPRPRIRCIRWGPSSPSRKGHSSPPPFGPCVLWPKGRPSLLLLSTCLWPPYVIGQAIYIFVL